MDPINTVMATMSVLNQVVATAKNLRDTDLKLNEAENKNMIADLYNALSDLKMNIADLKNYLISKDELIKDLQQKLQNKAILLWEDPFYYTQEADGGAKDGPFCQNCYDEKQSFLRLPRNDQNPFLKCNSCKNVYDKTNGNYVFNLKR